jgi:hypothetical protein
MKKLTAVLSFVLALAIVIPMPAFAQTFLTQTTLSSAISNTSTTTVVLASATGVTATSTVIFVDSEAMFVNAVNGTTLSVTRGYNGTQSGTHAASAPVLLGVPYAFAYQAPVGSCTRANVLYLPVIAFGVGGVAPTASDCIGGEWSTGPVAVYKNTVFRVLAPNSGGTAYTSLDTNGAATVAGTLNCTELDLPATKLLTGLGVMFGTTAGGSDKHLVALLDSTGNVLANSALAGATNSTASTYITFAFTSPYYAVPGQYFACTQSNGTSDTLRFLVTGTQDTYLTTSKTGTFGTIPTITVPTGFTTAVGPYMEAY